MATSKNDSIMSISLFQYQQIDNSSYFYNSFKLLGEGCSGRVFSGLLKQQNNLKQIAIKVIPKQQISDILHPRELEKLIGLQLKNVISILKIIQCQYHWVIAMERGSKNLRHYLGSQINSKLDYKQITSIFDQIVQGVLEIKANGFIHIDMKPQNILIDEDKKVKICDFDFMLKKTQIGKKGYKIGTKIYMAPQINQEKYYSQKSIVWSLGIILSELLCLYHPIEIEAKLSVGSKKNNICLLKDKLKSIQQNKNDESELIAIILNCLEQDYTLRPNLEQLLIKNSKVLKRYIHNQRKRSVSSQTCSSDNDQINSPNNYELLEILNQIKCCLQQLTYNSIQYKKTFQFLQLINLFIQSKDYNFQQAIVLGDQANRVLERMQRNIKLCSQPQTMAKIQIQLCEYIKSLLNIIENFKQSSRK